MRLRPAQVGGNEACSRCQMLDGRIYGEARIIGALRQCGWLTINEMCAMFGVHSRAVWRATDAMFKAGRLKRQWRELEGRPVMARNRYGGMVPSVTGNGGAWEYSLAMPKRRAA